MILIWKIKTKSFDNADILLEPTKVRYVCSPETFSYSGNWKSQKYKTVSNADYVEDNTLRFILRLCEKMKNFQAKMSPSATETSYVDPEAGDHEIFSYIRI